MRSLHAGPITGAAFKETLIQNAVKIMDLRSEADRQTVVRALRAALTVFPMRHTRPPPGTRLQ